ncbi:MAG: TatD family hydrolase [Firmicutes bacterium]|nr:TatD family hydrolase [Bacillota bacterium]
MVFIDTHAHLTDRRFSEDFEAVVARAKSAGVVTIINVGYDLPSSEAAIALAADNDNFFAAVGIHPHEASSVDQNILQSLKKLAAHPKVVAIGEIGLDYYYRHSEPKQQEHALRQQIRLARELALPVIIHDRDAHEDVLAILRAEKAAEVGGVMHCFSGDLDFALRCLELGFYISFAGTITFKKPGDLPLVAQKVPLERILIETDCPYLAPIPRRGRRNEPAYVVHVAEKIAELRQLELNKIAAITTQNAQRLFALTKNIAK